MVADVAQMLVNALLLAGVVRLSSGVPFRRFFVQIVSNSGVAYIGYGVIGFLLSSSGFPPMSARSVRC